MDRRYRESTTIAVDPSNHRRRMFDTAGPDPRDLTSDLTVRQSQ